MTVNVIKQIVQTYPEITEKYLDFLTSLNISFDDEVNKTDLSLENAEKFVISLKLQRYINKLEQERQELLKKSLDNGEKYNQEILEDINKKIEESNTKLELLLDMNDK